MPITFEATVNASLSWAQTDTEQGLSRVSNVGAVGIDQYLPMGTAASQINEVWHDVNDIAAGAVINLDLTALSLQLFNDIVVVSFSLVRAIAIRNVGVTPESAFDVTIPPDGLIGAVGLGPYPIHPGGIFILTNFVTGWPVAEATKLITLTGGVAESRYEIAIAGVK